MVILAAIVVMGFALGAYYRLWTGRDQRSEAPTPLTWNDLTVNPYDVDFKKLLEHWRWLVDESYDPLVISAAGDLFLEGQDGSMYWLDTGSGHLSKVAGSPEEFRALMDEQETRDLWFMTPLILDLRGSGMKLTPGQCYSYKIPPVLGGKFEVENFEPTDLQVHFGVLGQIHHQVKDLPPGTRIDDVKIMGLDGKGAGK